VRWRWPPAVVRGGADHCGGWRWAFFVNVPIGAAAWIAGRRVLVRSRPGAPGAAPDYLGAMLIALTLSALVLGITEGPAWGWARHRWSHASPGRWWSARFSFSDPQGIPIRFST